MTYEEQVAEARRLIATIDAVEPKQWDLARLCHQIVDVEGIPASRWAADIGRTVKHVYKLRRTWQRFGTHRDLDHDASFHEYFTRAALSDEQLRAAEVVAEERGVTVPTARDRYAEEVRSVRHALANPKVREDVLADTNTRRELYVTAAGDAGRRRELYATAAAVAAEQHAPIATPTPDPAPELTRKRSVYNDLQRVMDARLKLLQALEGFREHGIEPGDRPLLEDAIGQVDNILGWLRAWLEGGGGSSLDTQLDQLLTEG